MKQIDFSKRCFTGIMIEPLPAGKKFTCNIALTGIDELQIERFVAAYIGTGVTDLHVSRCILNNKKMKIYHSEKALTDDFDSNKPWFDTFAVINDDYSARTWIKGRAVITPDVDGKDWNDCILDPEDGDLVKSLTITIETKMTYGYDMELIVIPRFATDYDVNVKKVMDRYGKVTIKCNSEEEEEEEEEEDISHQDVLALLRRLLENE